MTDPIIAAATTEVATVKSKVTAFITANYSKVVSAAVGYGAAKLGVIGFILKVL